MIENGSLAFDIINALFEVLGSVAAWTNVSRLMRDKEVRGVYWPTVLFFSVWGFWNLLYYPSLGQIWSAVAGAVLALGNTMWVLLAISYLREDLKK